MSALTLSLFGRFQAALDDESLPGFRTVKVQALLIYLATESVAPHRRESLMTLLWPGMPERSARQNLRQTIYNLRRAIPDLPAQSDVEQAAADTTVPLLLANRQTIQLNPQANVDSDVMRFETLTKNVQTHDHLDLFLCHDCRQNLETAVSLYTGDFLADFYLDDSNAFEEWAEATRQAYRRQALDALETLTAIATRQTAYAEARAYAERQLEIDNLREGAYRQLMKIMALNGQRAEALALYDTCRRLLAEELGMAPTNRTTEVYEQIRGGDLSFAAPTAEAVRGFELKEKIGEGAYGAIHRAIQPAVGREVAVKVIRRKYADDPEFIRRFEAEAQTVARLEHPYIVPLYDYWREPAGAYLVMRLLRGGNLLTSLESGPWDVEPTLKMLDQITSALAAAHRRGVIHRDIKPANILFDEAGNAYLSDFGIAKQMMGDLQLTAVGGIMGTPDYISPEQLKDEPVSPPSDLYSLGAVLYETLTGERPFPNVPIATLLHKQLEEPFPPVSASRPDLPPQIDAIIQRATAKRPSDRFSDALSMAEAFRQAVRGRGAVQPVVIETAVPADIEIINPYKGLRAFQEADAADFYGRETLVEQLVNRMAESRFLAVVGPSGGGKSSVVKAGLIPALRQEALPSSDKWFVAEMTPDTHPLEELELALLPIAVDPPPSLVEPLQKDTRGLLRTVRRILPDENGAQLLLVIDQFEELFTLVEDEARRTHFLDSLVAALNAPRCPLRVVVTLRADFYDRPLQYQPLGSLFKQHTELVLPLTLDELTWAIQEPARRVGVGFEEGVVAAILDDVHDQPGTLPLLQYALTELFEERQDRLMTQAAYRAVGGVLGALGQRAEDLFASFDGASKGAARQLFLRLVTLGEGVEDTRRRVRLSELVALQTSEVLETSEVSDHFGRHRLLTFDHDPITREPTVEVAHEALLREWPRLRRWLEQSRDDVRLQRMLAAFAAEWAQKNRDEGLLLRGSRLDLFSGWAADSDLALTQDEHAYLHASVSAREQRKAAEQARQQRELETARQLAEMESRRAEEQTQAAQSLRQRAILLGGALVVVAILAATAFFFANQSNQNAADAEQNAIMAQLNADAAAISEAEAITNADLAATRAVEAVTAEMEAVIAQEAAQAEADFRATAEAVAVEERLEAETQLQLARSRELAGLAKETLETDPELAILLATEALSTTHTAEAENLLHQALLKSRIRQRFDSGIREDWIWPVAISPDGQYVAGWGFDISVWSASSGELLFQVVPKGYEDIFEGHLSFNTTSDRLATLGPEENFTLSFWELPSGEKMATLELPLPSANVSHFVLSPDWEQVVIGYADGTASLWAIDTGERLTDLSGHTSRVGFAFSADGQRLVSVDVDSVVKVWDTATGQESFTFFHDGLFFASYGSALSPDGRLLALVVHFQKIGIWDLEAVSDNPSDPVRLTTLTGGHTLLPFSSHFSADGTKVVTGSRDQSARVWDPFTGEELLVLANGSSNALVAAFNSDGDQLVTGSIDGTVKLWDLSPSGAEESYTIPLLSENTEGAIALSPDNSQLAVVNSEDYAVTVWDVASKQLILTLNGHTADIASIKYSPNGSQIATASEDGTARVWDAATGEPLLILEGHGERLSGLSFEGVWGVDYSPDGDRLATAGRDGTARIWDTHTGEELLVMNHVSSLLDVRFSPDGALLATAMDETNVPDATDATVALWDIATGEQLITLPQSHGDRVWTVDFSPDGTRLATGGGDGTIKLWQLNAAAGTVDLVATLLGHTGSAFGVSFSPNGQLLASKSTQLKLWDLSVLPAVNQDNPTATTLTTPRFTLPIGGSASNFLFTADSSTLIYTYPTWSGDQEAARFISLSIDDLMNLAQERLTRTFTEEECLLYRIESCSQDG